jgi:hypothetical protein
MSIVKDLREALQDVVAPDLKAVVQGLAELRAEVRDGNSLLRAEIQQSREDSKREIDLLRQESKQGLDLLRQESRESVQLLRDEMRAGEVRTGERLQHVYDAVKLADTTRRNAELEKTIEELRNKQTQQ